MFCTGILQNNLFDIFILGSFEVDIGYTINGTNSYISEDTATSAKDCQERCRNKRNCKVFTYEISNTMCYLMSLIESRYNQKGLISGSRSCEGNINTF